MKRKTNKLNRTALAAGVLSMVLSVCLCVGSTYAWFNHSLGSENTITIGTFGTVATVGLSEARSSTPLSSADTIFPAGSYDLSVRGVGNTPGYALIFLEAATSDFRKDTYYTPQLNNGTGYTYRIVLHEPTAIRVTPVWGRMEGDAPLKEDKIIWYGRPPIVEQPEEEQTQSAAAEQSGGVSATPSTESPETVTPNDSTQTALTTDSTSTTIPADGANTTIGGTDSAQSNYVTGSTEAAPATGATQTSTTTGSTDGASASVPLATSADSTATTTGGAANAPATGADPE